MNNDSFFKLNGRKLMSYMDRNDSEKIVQEINRLIQDYPEKKGVLYHMLGAHYMLNDTSEDRYYKAIDVYKKLLHMKDVEEKYVKVDLVNLAFAFKAVNKPNSALIYLDKWIKEYSDDDRIELKCKKQLIETYKDLLKQ